MGEKRVKTFHDITARRWNDIINAVNSRRPADSIYPPLEEHELTEFRKMEAQSAEKKRHRHRIHHSSDGGSADTHGGKMQHRGGNSGRFA